MQYRFGVLRYVYHNLGYASLLCICAYLAAHENLSDALTEKDTCDQNGARNNFTLNLDQTQILMILKRMASNASGFYVGYLYRLFPAALTHIQACPHVRLERLVSHCPRQPH